MIGCFIYGGLNCRDFGIYISGSGTFNSAERDVEKVEIPGRNGDLLIDNNRFKNVPITYPAFIREKFLGLTDYARMWLLAQSGYRKLEDTYHPDEYRVARFAGPLDFDVRLLNRSGECNISFDCMPQRFLKSGETTLDATGGLQLVNPTPFTALPLIRVYGTSGTLMVGDNIVQISQIDGYVDIDSETQNAYKGTTNCNRNISAPVFPQLPEGQTGISAEGSITKVEITPRWWRI